MIERSAFRQSSLLWLALVFSSAPYLSGRSISFDQLQKNYEQQIRWVTVCESWTHEDDRGFFRITEAYIYAQSFLYAQWMNDYDHSTAMTEGVATVSFEEVFNDHAEIELSEIRCEDQPSGAKVEAIAFFGHEDKRRRMVLQLFDEPGKYKLEFVDLESNHR